MTTEFDEQIMNKSKGRIKQILIEKYKQFLCGEETMGVLSGYEMSAIKCGISMTEIEEWYKENI